MKCLLVSNTVRCDPRTCHSYFAPFVTATAHVPSNSTLIFQPVAWSPSPCHTSLVLLTPLLRSAHSPLQPPRQVRLHLHTSMSEKSVSWKPPRNNSSTQTSFFESQLQSLIQLNELHLLQSHISYHANVILISHGFL